MQENEDPAVETPPYAGDPIKGNAILGGVADMSINATFVKGMTMAQISVRTGKTGTNRRMGQRKLQVMGEIEQRRKINFNFIL